MRGCVTIAHEFTWLTADAREPEVEMITLYHAPRSRSSRIIWLLEELGVPYRIELTSIVRGDGTGAPAPDSYTRIHPLKKVPAIEHNGAVVYESAGIVLYLSDRFPKAGIGPMVGDPKRADYLRWLFFYPSILEPAAAARIRGWDKEQTTGFGKFEDVEGTIAQALEAGPYILGEKFSAADTLYCSVCQFFKGNLFPARKCYDDYVTRCTSRPAYIRAIAKDNG
jgi:glutathione S-transferase